MRWHSLRIGRDVATKCLPLRDALGNTSGILRDFRHIHLVPERDEQAIDGWTTVGRIWAQRGVVIAEQIDEFFLTECRRGDYRSKFPLGLASIAALELPVADGADEVVKRGT
jgi:hypothetical protein